MRLWLLNCVKSLEQARQKKKRLHKAKKKALSMAATDFTNSYKRLQDYAYILLATNRGATIKIQQEPTRVFKRIFMSFMVQ